MVSMASFAKKAAATLALLVALGANQASAYTKTDACSMSVVLNYYTTNDDANKGGSNALVSTLSFPIQAGAGATNDGSSSAINDGITAAELQLQPGFATVSITGNLCSSHPDSSDNGGSGIAFQAAESVIQEISGTSGAVTLTLIALDAEAAAALDESIDYNPIITSVAISPAVGTYDGASTFSFTAVDPVDPINGASISDYQLTYDNSGEALAADQKSLTLSHFDSSVDSCSAGGPSCDITYQPALPEAGNYKWKMTVTDATGLTDEVIGYFAVDAAGTIALNVENWHVPVIDHANLPVTCTGTCAGAVSSHVAYGDTATVTFTVTDPDYINGLGAQENNVLTVTAVSDGAQVTEGAQTNVDCVSSDVVITRTVTADAGGVETWTAVYQPWVSNTGGAAAYGETFCAFEFQVEDAAGLKSDAVTITLGSWGTESTGGEATSQIPHFTVIFVSDTAPVNAEVVTATVHFEDADSFTNFAITHGGVLSDVAWADETGADVENNVDCTSGCTKTIAFTMAADANTQGDPTVVLTLTDVDDAGLVDTAILTFAPTASSRRNRRASPETGVLAVARRADNLPKQIETSALSIVLEGTKATVTTASLQGHLKKRAKVPEVTGTSVPGDVAPDQVKLGATAIGALAGVAVLAVVLVGVIVRTKQVARRLSNGPAAAPKLEEGNKDEIMPELEYDEYNQGNTLKLATPAGAPDGFTTMI